MIVAPDAAKLMLMEFRASRFRGSAPAASSCPGISEGKDAVGPEGDDYAG